MRKQLLAVLIIAGAPCIGVSDVVAQEAGEGGEQVRSAESSDQRARERLRTLEAKYQKTGDASYLFERVLTLEQLGEYKFALEILENHRTRFESHDGIDGVAVVEQRLRDHLADRTEASTAAGSTARPRTDAPGVDLIGWTITGAGTLALAGGISQIVVAEQRANRLRCSPAARGPDAEGCSRVDPYRDLTRREFNQKKAGVGRRRWIGIGLAGLGTAAAGWGIYRLLSAEASPDESTKTARLRWTAGWTSGGPVVRARVQF